MKEILTGKAVTGNRRSVGSGSTILAVSGTVTLPARLSGPTTALNRAGPQREPEESSRACLRAIEETNVTRRRPGRTDGITPRFESMLQEASRAGFEAGYRAAFQALGLDARAVRVLRVLSARELPKTLGAIQANDRVAILRRLEEMPPGDE